MAEREVVLITGGSGLVGGASAVRLGARYQVVAFDRAGPPQPPAGVETVEVDLADDSSVREGLKQVRERHGARLASVFHCGAYYDFEGRPSPHYEEVNVRGTARLFEGLRETFESVGQFVFASTMIVHAPTTPGLPIREGSPLGPKWEYAGSKLRAEEWLRAHRGDVPLVVFRIACVYDRWCHHHLLAEQIRRVYEGRLTARVFPGDPTHGQAFVHLDDLLDALETAIARRAELPGDLTLLLGEADVVGYDEAQRTLGTILQGKARAPLRVPKALARLGAQALGWLPGADPFIKPWMIDLADDHYAVNPDRARDVLGWSPRHSLRDELPALAAALREGPAAWYRENGMGPPPR